MPAPDTVNPAAAPSASLADALRLRFGAALAVAANPAGMLSLCLSAGEWLAAAEWLRTDAACRFEILIDVAGLDLLDHGKVEWRTSGATGTGFSRGVNRGATAAGLALGSEGSGAAASPEVASARFHTVYQLLSVSLNHRLLVHVICDGAEEPTVPSVCGVWASANWFEREAWDLYGIEFRGHPDLRRILTDYGFVGHPFRKDFPLIGNVEVRYDAVQRRVVYEPVSIEPRTLVPRVIREDNRYDPALLGHAPAAAPPAPAVPAGGAK